ncbi:D-alanine-activating enzyme [Lactobacillus selangorensis]|uniref:D-alanine--D-alanyl carrier protein ligase n=1 Tax=Lactobacillus selangorensis TaxID=81857 RepID=A0A0R2FS54_9LACO|nr:D-alanine--poly(phosphoribitol) ligase subunit DltA [Lactobacillus selangorensis]KRN27460.1 D-alanine-activating enzyme [Lactobacillus selangorensis]KRN31343.1 D-alanine-activating enzyme [Lactobacillus selangorensis]
MIDNIITAIDHYGETDPERICYIYGQDTNTYGELKTKSDHLAQYFAQSELPDGAPVMVFGGQTFEMIVTFLGLVKSGHAYIPVDTHSPNERLTQIDSIAHPAAVVAVADLPIEMPDLKNFTHADLAAAVQTGTDGYDHDKAVAGADNYYIIFTSGTTGLPKGVQISHANLLSYVNWAVNDFDLHEGVHALSQAPYSFDLSVMDLYPTLVLGGKLSALPRAVTENFKKLFEVLPNLKINEWVSTPSFVEICLLEPTFDAAHYPDLTHFLFCGEELTNKTAANLQKRFPDAEIYNTYGPTETTVAVTGVKLTPEILKDYERLPIGYAKEDMKIWVVDEQGAAVKPGTTGELYIAGPSVSKGYLNNPAKTEKAFFTEDGQQAYRSGDLGFVNDKGLFFYRGRTDFQVKLHGYRIELEDIDHNLDQVKYVKQATTAPKYNAAHQVTQIVAYVVPNQNDFKDEFALTQAIKKELGQEVMSYMIPKRFVFRDQLPLTANGKVDRKALIAEVNK